ncbi:hypothetical protein GCM10009864_51190 [Streptomyces lunalinharesii]|uniref:Uncharacterized protein n=1 Tax=Streptomyces lunalinharesii TaxID=333384 RepID=A0ABP6ET36_9ACTN
MAAEIGPIASTPCIAPLAFARRSHGCEGPAPCEVFRMTERPSRILMIVRTLGGTLPRRQRTLAHPPFRRSFPFPDDRHDSGGTAALHPVHPRKVPVTRFSDPARRGTFRTSNDVAYRSSTPRTARDEAAP